MNFIHELNLSTDPWRVWWSWSWLSCSLWCLAGSCAPLASRTASGLWSWGAQTSASGLPARCKTGSRTCSTDPGWIHSRPSARGSGLRSCPSRRSSSWTVPCAAGQQKKEKKMIKSVFTNLLLSLWIKCPNENLKYRIFYHRDHATGADVVHHGHAHHAGHASHALKVRVVSPP